MCNLRWYVILVVAAICLQFSNGATTTITPSTTTTATTTKTPTTTTQSTTTTTTPTTTTTAAATTKTNITANPSFSPSGGSYAGAILVTISCSTSSLASIYYTTDGSDPAVPGKNPSSTQTLYSNPLRFDTVGTIIIKAIAVSPGLTESNKTFAIYLLAFGSGSKCPLNYYQNCTKYCLPSDTCSNHGTCSNLGTCICDQSYFGTSCSQYSAPLFTSSIAVISGTEFSLSVPSILRIDFPSSCLPVFQTTIQAQGYPNTLLPPTASTNVTMNFLGNVIQMSPSIIFNTPVVMTLQFASSLAQNPANVRICLFNEATRTWDIVGGASVAISASVTATVPHFSKFVAAEIFGLSQTSPLATSIPSTGTTAAANGNILVSTDSSSTSYRLSLPLGGFIALVVGVFFIIVLSSLFVYWKLKKTSRKIMQNVEFKSRHDLREFSSDGIDVGYLGPQCSTSIIYAPVGSYVTPKGFVQSLPNAGKPPESKTMISIRDKRDLYRELPSSPSSPPPAISREVEEVLKDQLVKNSKMMGIYISEGQEVASSDY